MDNVFFLDNMGFFHFWTTDSAYSANFQSYENMV